MSRAPLTGPVFLRGARQLAIVSGGCLVLLASGVLLTYAFGQGGSEVVATKLRIVDSKGQTAVLFGAGPSGDPSMFLMKDGKLRVSITATTDTSSVELYSRSGDKTRVELRVDESDMPVLAMADAYNTIRAQVFLEKRSGTPNIRLFDDRRRPRAALSLTQEGDAALALYDKDGRPVGGAFPTGLR